MLRASLVTFGTSKKTARCHGHPINDALRSCSSLALPTRGSSPIYGRQTNGQLSGAARLWTSRSTSSFGQCNTWPW